MAPSLTLAALQAVAVLFVTGLLYVAYLVLVVPRSSPLRHLPGPPSPGFFSRTHLKWVLHGERSQGINEALIARYGRNVRIQGLGKWEDRLFTLDPVVVSHIMNRAQDYQKPWQSRRVISNLIGMGLLAAEGHQHRVQRRIANPTFSKENLRGLTPLFLRKARELRDKWLSLLSPDNGTPPAKIDPNHWFGRVTFDIIGLAGFDYDFGAVQDETNEVYLAYRDMFEVAINNGHSLKQVIAIYWPLVDTLFPDNRTRVVAQSRKVIAALGHRMITEKKAALQSGGPAVGKDLLTLLLKSNMSSDIPSDQRISEEDMLNEINTFLFAGSDTTALAMTWILFHLTKAAEVQTRLRDELRSIALPDSDEDAHELFQALDALPFFDNVVREGLRLVSPVHSTLRVAMKDDEIPTSEEITYKDGSKRRSVRIRAGQIVHIPMEGLNLDRQAWGPDGWEFDPDRWDDLPEKTLTLPGIYSKTMTFSMGPRACIGYRFSIMEIKIFLFVLITTFSFTDSDDVYKGNVVLTRPFVRGDRNGRSKCPMRVVPLPQ